MGLQNRKNCLVADMVESLAHIKACQAAVRKPPLLILDKQV